MPGLRIVMPPELSIFTFKLAPPGLDGEALDNVNIELLAEVHRHGNVLLSPFRSIHGAPGELSIRMAILSHRTDVVAVDVAVSDILAAAERIRLR